MKTKPRTQVCYFGERICIYELCEMAKVDVKTFLRRWRDAGKPDDITLLGHLLAPSRKSHPFTFVVVDGDNEAEMTIAKAIKVFMTSDYTIRRRIEKYGTRIPIEKMRVNIHMRDKCRAGNRSRTTQEWDGMNGNKRPVAFDQNKPGWAEQKYFPNAGANGFPKAEKTGINAHCDRCTILPILNGD